MQKMHAYSFQPTGQLGTNKEQKGREASTGQYRQVHTELPHRMWAQGRFITVEK